jgi:hypothetical protein
VQALVRSIDWQHRSLAHLARSLCGHMHAGGTSDFCTIAMEQILPFCCLLSCARCRQEGSVPGSMDAVTAAGGRFHGSHDADAQAPRT